MYRPQPQPRPQIGLPLNVFFVSFTMTNQSWIGPSQLPWPVVSLPARVEHFLDDRRTVRPLAGLAELSDRLRLGIDLVRRELTVLAVGDLPRSQVGP